MIRTKSVLSYGFRPLEQRVGFVKHVLYKSESVGCVRENAVQPRTVGDVAIQASGRISTAQKNKGALSSHLLDQQYGHAIEVRCNIGMILPVSPFVNG